ncbi:MAG TPA: hypothetical protein IAA03_07375 [Candidatus Ruminococcus avistercoris]|nr:hypothetical protein [Candidatus Ruminococcus avistercoris]
MLKKLFKYEWKASSRLLLAVYGIVILFSILSRIFMEVSGINGSEEAGLPILETIAALFLMLSVVMLCCSVVFTWVFIAYRFYKSVFTEQGYLTNTLPVTQQQIIVAKGLVGVIWQIVNLLLVMISFFIIAATPKDLGMIFRAIPDLFKLFVNPDIGLTMWMILAAVILSPFTMVMEMYMCVAIGNLLNGHKVLGAVGTYAGIYAVQQIIAIIVMAATSMRFVSVDYNTTSEQAQGWVLNFVNINLVMGIVLGAILLVVGYLVTKHIMTKKLNLQ